MSKSKFLKKLLMGGLCALTATAMIGATACKPDNGGNDEPDPDHVHNYATTYKSDKDGHWHECLNAGHGKVTDEEKEAHVDADNNKKCDVCDYDMSTGSTPATEITVTFDLDGGSWSRENTLKLTNGKLPTDLPTPTKADKVFGGWLNGTTPVVPGVTVLTSNVTLKAKWTEPTQLPAKTGVFTVSQTLTDTYEKGADISDTDLFTLKAGEAVVYSKGKDSADLGVSVTNADGSITANQALKQTSNVGKGEYVASLYEITAKANATVKILVHFVNDSWNSDRAGADITWSLGSGAVQSVKSVSRKDALIAIEASIPEGETLHIGVNNTSSDAGKLWLFSVEGTEQQNKVAVNYYNGAEEEDNLILTQFVASGATIEAPAKNPVTISYTSQFLGWYDAATGGNAYSFGTASATTSIYAHYKVSDATVIYYEADGTTVYETVAGYIGEATTAISGKPSHAQGANFLYWATKDGDTYTEYQFTTTLTGDLSLYPVYEEVVSGTLSATLQTNKSSLGLTGSADWSDISADLIGKENAEDAGTKIASVTISAILNSSTNDSRIRVAGLSTLTFVLEANYTYTITINAASSGSSARTIKLTGPNEYSNTVSAITNGTAVDNTWENLTAGTYVATLDTKSSNNFNIYSITIIATPV